MDSPSVITQISPIRVEEEASQPKVLDFASLLRFTRAHHGPLFDGLVFANSFSPSSCGNDGSWCDHGEGSSTSRTRKGKEKLVEATPYVPSTKVTKSQAQEIDDWTYAIFDELNHEDIRPCDYNAGYLAVPTSVLRNIEKHTNCIRGVIRGASKRPIHLSRSHNDENFLGISNWPRSGWSQAISDTEVENTSESPGVPQAPATIIHPASQEHASIHQCSSGPDISRPQAHLGEHETRDPRDSVIEDRLFPDKIDVDRHNAILSSLHQHYKMEIELLQYELREQRRESQSRIDTFVKQEQENQARIDALRKNRRETKRFCHDRLHKIQRLTFKVQDQLVGLLEKWHLVKYKFDGVDK